MKLPPVPCRKSAKAEKFKTDFPDFPNQRAWPFIAGRFRKAGKT